MVKQFYISGGIVDNDIDKSTFEDVTPVQVNSFIKNLDDGDDVELIINSPGGSVTAGIAIASAIKRAQSNGHHFTAKIEGLAASIATVIACACEKMTITESSFFMIHLCWTMVQGNSTDLRKEADVMDQMNEAILSFYRSKFDCPDEVIRQMMEDETWIVGKDAKAYCLNIEVVEDTSELRYAACLRNAKFNKLPNLVREALNMENENKETVVDECKAEETAEVVEETKEEQPVDVEKTDVEKTDVEVQPELVPVDEVNKRVSGMQSVMAKKMDVLRTDYENKITDFTNQLKAKDEELTSVRNEVISLNRKLEEANKELQATASALMEKKTALELLNSSVNTPADVTVGKNWKNLHGQEFFDFIKEHPEVVTNK